MAPDELRELHRGYRDEQRRAADDPRLDPDEPTADRGGRRERDPGSAGMDAVTRADALGLSHHDRCERPGDPPLGVTGDLDDLLGCWRCWYISARRRD